MRPIPYTPLSKYFSLVLLSSLIALSAKAKNGFDLNSSLIPVAQIQHGGPPKDGIPAIDKPKFVSAYKASFLAPDDRILGIEYQGKARAYPIKILNWHEIVNDRIGDYPFVVTYCPLCGTGMAFEARQGDSRLTFGVSGLLYQSDVLLYDRQSESLWSQIMAQAVSGPKAGQKLKQIALRHTSWQQWRQDHPDTKVLSTETGHMRDYSRDPYGRYANSQALYFEVNNAIPEGYHPKEWVMGIHLGDQSKAYPFAELARNGKSAVLSEKLGTQEIRVIWNQDSSSAYATDAEGKLLATTMAYWFAWYTFYPNTLVYTHDASP